MIEDPLKLGIMSETKTLSVQPLLIYSETKSKKAALDSAA